MKTTRRWAVLPCLAGLAVLAGCGDGLLRPAAPGEPAAVAIAASLDFSAGGINEAYQKVNQLSVRFLASGEERLAQVVPFDPGASETVISLQVPLNEVRESFSIELELRAGSQALFRGSGTAQLSAGGAQEVVIPIVPIVSGVTCSGTPFQIRVYQAARRLTAAALFASGDTVPGVTIGWSTSDAATVTISQAGDATGLRDGTATVTCSAQGFSSTRQVEVLAAVASVQVVPAQDTAVVGTSVTFAATLRDSLGHAITTPRTTSWSSSNNGIATVNAAGQATAVAAGTATITATSGGASGSATLLVIFRPPVVSTTAPTGVGAAAATLNGSVNPQGASAQAWFEWGTAPDLAGAAATPPQQLEPGNAAQAVSRQVTGLLANQTYYFRAVASSAGGTVRGNILNFIWAAAPVVRTISGTPVLTGASLQGGVNPQGLATQAWFEWSTSPTLAGAQQTPVQNLAAGNRAELPTSASLSHLTPGATYYFRAAASNSVGTSYGQIMSLRANGPPAATTLPAAVAGLSATLAGTVNPGGSSTDTWFEWGTSPSLSGAASTPAQNIGAGSTDVAVSAGISGLSGGVTYYYRVAATSQFGTARGSILSFTTPIAPTATTLPATGVAGSVATLQGVVNPNGTATTAWFEWGTNPSLGNPASTAAQNLGADTAALAMSENISGLAVGVTYYFRVVASNSAGTTLGSILPITAASPPSATTLAPTSLTGTSVTMQGSANPNGTAATAWFEWGPGTAPTGPASTAAQSVGAGTSAVPISEPLSGLGASTTYAYRTVANNAAGTVRGNWLSFTTLPLPVATTLTSYYGVFGPGIISFLQGATAASAYATDVWFEYSATDATLATPSSTTVQIIPIGGDPTNGYNFFAQVPDRVWFRAVARHPGGTTRGAILRTQLP